MILHMGVARVPLCSIERRYIDMSDREVSEEVWRELSQTSSESEQLDTDIKNLEGPSITKMPKKDIRRFDEIVRRLKQTDAALEQATEAEDFQAIGMR
jgi:hypothetical protein